MDALAQNAADFAGADAVFCTLGTTRGAAGSAAAMRRVDLEYVDAAGAAARAAGVPHFALLTAQGARRDVWHSELRLFHPLFYMHLKGAAEAAVEAKGFPRVSIFRPGMLDRGGAARFGEALALKLLPSTPVADVARAMIAAVERDAAAARAATAPVPPAVYETADIRALASSAA
jgi:oxidoreductase